FTFHKNSTVADYRNGSAVIHSKSACFICHCHHLFFICLNRLYLFLTYIKLMKIKTIPCLKDRRWKLSALVFYFVIDHIQARRHNERQQRRKCDSRNDCHRQRFKQCIAAQCNRQQCNDRRDCRQYDRSESCTSTFINCILNVHHTAPSPQFNEVDQHDRIADDDAGKRYHPPDTHER